MVLVSINGQFKREISVNDRGLLFGESIYEVIPLYNNKPFGLDEHLARLIKSFAMISNHPLSLNKLKKWIAAYIDRLPKQTLSNIYVQITSGSIPLRNHSMIDTTPNCIIHQTKQAVIRRATYQKGFRTICVPDQRAENFSEIKSNHLAYNNYHLIHAYKRGYDDALFTRNQHIVEGVSSNIFAVVNGVITTPPSEKIVSGLTRKRLIAIIQEENLPFEIAPLPFNSIACASEIFLTSTTRLLRPLIEIKHLFKKTAPGIIWQKLFQCYLNKIYDACGQPITID